jgi:hypothetical protein
MGLFERGLGVALVQGCLVVQSAVPRVQRAQWCRSLRCSACSIAHGADAPRVQRARGAAVPRCRSLRVRQRGSVLADATLSKGGGTV